MRAIILILLSAPLLAFSQSAIDEDIIVMKIMKGELNLKRELIFPKLGRLDSNDLNALVSKQKLAFPDFKKSYLYTQFVDDGSWRYDITYDFTSKKCQLRSVRVEDLQRSIICEKKIILCANEGDGLNLKNANSCKDKIDECNTISNTAKLKTIDNKVCQKIFQ